MSIKREKFEVLGDAVLDLGKLTFAGIVLTSIFDSNVDKVFLIIVGIVMCVILLLIGIILVTRNKNKEG